MRVIHARPRDGNLYFVLSLPGGERRLYRIAVSVRKMTAQMERVKGPEAEVLLRRFDKQ